MWKLPEVSLKLPARFKCTAVLYQIIVFFLHLNAGPVIWDTGSVGSSSPSDNCEGSPPVVGYGTNSVLIKKRNDATLLEVEVLTYCKDTQWQYTMTCKSEAPTGPTGATGPTQDTYGSGSTTNGGGPTGSDSGSTGTTDTGSTPSPTGAPFEDLPVPLDAKSSWLWVTGNFVQLLFNDPACETVTISISVFDNVAKCGTEYANSPTCPQSCLSFVQGLSTSGACLAKVQASIAPRNGFDFQTINGEANKCINMFSQTTIKAAFETAASPQRKTHECISDVYCVDYVRFMRFTTLKSNYAFILFYLHFDTTT